MERSCGKRTDARLAKKTHPLTARKSYVSMKAGLQRSKSVKELRQDIVLIYKPKSFWNEEKLTIIKTNFLGKQIRELPKIIC